MDTGYQKPLSVNWCLQLLRVVLSAENLLFQAWNEGHNLGRLSFFTLALRRWKLLCSVNRNKNIEFLSITLLSMRNAISHNSGQQFIPRGNVEWLFFKLYFSMLRVVAAACKMFKLLAILCSVSRSSEDVLKTAWRRCDPGVVKQPKRCGFMCWMPCRSVNVSVPMLWLFLWVSISPT